MTGPHEDGAALPRHIVHPGPPAPERFRFVECRAHSIALTVGPGASVNEAIAEAFAGQGFEGGFVRIRDVTMKQLDYVMPAASPDESHAAWYSETFSMPGGTIIDAGLHMGRRDDKPFLHCHGSWRGPDGVVAMGHILPFHAEFSQEVTLEALALDGALLEVQADPETCFSLFSPVPRPRINRPGGRRAILCTVRPNVDLTQSVEAICQETDLRNAKIEGIGSLVGADYEDGTTLTAFASEILVRKGQVSAADQQARAVIDIDMVDLTGRISGGTLIRGKNPVCVTAELLLVDIGA